MQPERMRWAGWLAGIVCFAAFVALLGVGAPDPYAPEPPGVVEALPLHMAVKMIWEPSPSRDLLGYRLCYKMSDESWDAGVVIDNVTSPHVVSHLANSIPCDFMVVAVDVLGNESTGIVVSAAPCPAVTIDGVGDYRTVQAAIEAALPGETVLLGPGVFEGNLLLRAGVSLEGYSTRYTEVLGEGSGPVIVVEGLEGTDPASRIEKLSVTGGEVGFDGGTAALEVKDVVVDGLPTGGPVETGDPPALPMEEDGGACGALGLEVLLALLAARVLCRRR